MRAGPLRNRLVFQSRATTLNDYQESVTAWANYVTVWGSFEPISGREKLRGGQNLADVIVRCLIRWRSDITPQMRIVFGSRAYDIQSVFDPKDRREYLEIMCQLSPESIIPAGAVTADGDAVTADGAYVTAT